MFTVRALLRSRNLTMPVGRISHYSSSTPTVTNSHSIDKFVAIGRDFPLKVIPRNIRRQNRLKYQKETVVRTSSLPSRIAKTILLATVSGSIIWNFAMEEKLKDKIRGTLSDTFLGDIYRSSAEKVAEIAKPFTDPSAEKLLPDWPPPGTGIPAHVPQVPVLVIDVEDTLVHSEWDNKHGWRHAKRPGMDLFLETLMNYYEIVLFSENQQFEEFWAKLDRKHAAMHYLHRGHTRYYNGSHVKDLSSLNRDLRLVVMLDDDPLAYQLQPENAIPVKPFTDPRDRHDTGLTDLIPFLKALASERVPDVRDVLNDFRDTDGIIRDLPTKYAAQVHALEKKKEAEKKKGLGGFLRQHVPARSSVTPSSSLVTKPRSGI